MGSRKTSFIRPDSGGLKLNKTTKILGCYAAILVITVLMIKLLTYDVKNEPVIETDSRPHHRKLTILLSQPRSGSSWIGSFFDSHPDVFYVYEPLHPQVYRDSKIQLSEEKFQQEILRSLCECEFSEDVISHGIQDRSSKISESKGVLGVLPPSPDQLSAKCRESKHTVAKVLQLRDVNILTTLSTECEISVIHLVRDPRASIKSRVDTFRRLFAEEPELEEFTPDIIRNSSEKICREIARRADQLGENSIPYFTLRYESVVKNPVREVREMLGRVGVEWSEEVEQRVVHSTSGTAQGGGFDTVKDSARVVGAWRRDAGEDFVRAVEAGCHHVMQTFRYPLLYPEFLTNHPAL